MPHAQHLIDKFKRREALVGVVGLGYVGLPLILGFSEAGLRCLGFDIDQEKIDCLQRAETYIRTIDASRIAGAAARGPGGFDATSEYSRAGEPDAIIICVPTPLTPDREPDLSFVTQTLESLLPNLRPGQLLCLESTTYPGTTEEVLAPRLAARGLTIGEDFFLAFSPEREDPGNERFNTRNIPKLCAGTTPACLQVAVALYSQAIDTVVPVSSTRAAEMAKLLENIHRAVNIGLVNEMKQVADRMGIDIHEVIRAAATKPFGFTPYYPGPGLGGHCIPIDPFYLTWKAKQLGIATRFIELAGEVNRAMPDWVVDKLVAGLTVLGKAIGDSRVLVLGLAYKKNVDDVRESPAAQIMELLRERGAALAYSDPFVPQFPKMREHRFDLRSVPLDPATIASFDCVVLVTDHDAFDYASIRQHARLLVDTRGRYPTSGPNLIKA